MQVIYAIGSRLAKGGIGEIAYHAVERIHKNKLLHKVITLDRAEERINPEILKRHHNVRFPLYRIAGLFPRRRFYMWKNYYFDRVTRHHLTAGAHIFHGWACQCLESLKRAKKLGLTTFIDRASMHVNVSDRLISEEYAQFGLKKDLPLNYVRKLSLEEYDLADFVIVPSQSVYESFLEEGFDEKKLIRIPFGVDPEVFQPGQKQDNVFRLAFVGQVGIRKGIHYLLRAWQELSLKNAELVLVGEVVPDGQQLFKKHLSESTVKLAGHVNDPQRFYAQASVFVLPSVEEGSALVSYEAMACGRPVIVTQNVGSVARDGVDGFVIPIRNVDALKEKILFFYEHPDKIAEMGINARRRAAQFSWDSYGDNIVQAYARAGNAGTMLDA